MKIEQDATLSADPVLSAAVAKQDGLLASTVGGAAAAATWHLGADGRAGLLLQLHDREGRLLGGAEFEPAELEDAGGLAARFADLRAAAVTVAGWRGAVGRLFDRVEPWCRALPGGPHVTRWPHRLVREVWSGGYEVPELRVVRGRHLMFVPPVGVRVLGADGRVDLLGPGDRAILHYARASDSWYHVPNAAPYRELPLDEPLFRRLAEACLDD